MIDLTLNGVDLSDACPEAFVKRVNRPLAGEVRDELVAAPGRPGSWKFPEQPGDVLITVDVVVLVDDIADRRAAIRTLAAWARTPDGPVQLVIDDEPDRYWQATIAVGAPMDDDEYEGVTTLQFAADPFAYATDTSTETVTATGGSPDSGVFAVELGGPLVVDPVIEITPTDGTITSLELSGWGGSLAWQVDAPGDPNTIVEDGTLTISSISQTVTIAANDDMELTGVFDPDDVDMANVAIGGGFPFLVDGNNDWALVWSGTATEVEIVYTWRERYI